MRNKEDNLDKTVKISQDDNDFLDAIFRIVSAKMVTNDRKQVSKKSIQGQFNQTIKEHLMMGGSAMQTDLGRIEFTSDELKSELSK